ncbi:potassium transporter TrkA [Micromonospora cathayae]|uniref:Potassium transporter TrkA n=1 Tax=Micromonospora cathayae TaxID=3028804 RepID=A0ABY7ZZ01_9ACTN|nr:potassium transporter TrkA [Micromonospora sp. HUAS 3]WDZ87119.1 potassium transporter TrkA [Micromonospora sp. HUAS 3]
MNRGIEVTELFGIGTKYEITCTRRQRLAVVVLKDGRRELYAFEAGNNGDEPSAVIQLDEDEARRVAAVLLGTYFQD